MVSFYKSSVASDCKPDLQGPPAYGTGTTPGRFEGLLLVAISTGHPHLHLKSKDIFETVVKHDNRSDSQRFVIGPAIFTNMDTA